MISLPLECTAIESSTAMLVWFNEVTRRFIYDGTVQVNGASERNFLDSVTQGHPGLLINPIVSKSLGCDPLRRHFLRRFWQIPKVGEPPESSVPRQKPW